MMLQLLLTITWVYEAGAANVRLTQLPLCMGKYHNPIHKARGAMVTSDDFFFFSGVFCMTINIVHHMGSWTWGGWVRTAQVHHGLSSLSRNKTVK